MSGVSTRSHRSSVRGVEATLAELSDLLKANKSIVMITGAGLSAASGERRFYAGGGRYVSQSLPPIFAMDVGLHQLTLHLFLFAIFVLNRCRKCDPPPPHARGKLCSAALAHRFLEELRVFVPVGVKSSFNRHCRPCEQVFV